MCDAWLVEELVFSRLTSNGVTASCRLVESFEIIQLGKADQLLV